MRNRILDVATLAPPTFVITKMVHRPRQKYTTKANNAILYWIVGRPLSGLVLVCA